MYKFSEFIGIPFVEGGRTEKGADCWGLVEMVYKKKFPELVLPDINVHCGIADSQSIDSVAYYIKQQFVQVDKISYSIILIKHNDPVYVNHVGVYLGDNKFIHSRRKIGVNIDDITSMAWKRKIAGYYLPKELLLNDG